MGVVLLARHRLLERQVAVKLRHEAPDASDDALLAERFRQGARLQAELDHPHIARVYDYLESPSFQAMVLEYLPGGSIDQQMKGETRSLPLEHAVEIGIRCADALAYAHRRGVVHRDIKPANLMLVDADDPRTVRITDYGVAKDPDRSPDLTMAGANVGTLWYMPPEQFNQETPTPLVDVYSLGATIYEMLTGQLPFENEDTGEIFRRFLDKVPPPPIRGRNSDVPEALACVVEHALEIDIERRVPTAASLSLLLRAVAEATGLGIGEAEARRLVEVAGDEAEAYADQLPIRAVGDALRSVRSGVSGARTVFSGGGSTMNSALGLTSESPIPLADDPLGFADDDDDRTIVMALPPLDEE
jgi:serine/threonine-protein kinase